MYPYCMVSKDSQLRRIALIVVLGIALILMAAALLDSLVFNNVNMLASKDCPVPCWRGISPGVAHSDDVIRLLRNDIFVRGYGLQTELNNPFHSQVLNGASAINWDDWRGGLNHALIKNDLVLELGVRNYSRLTIETVVDELGPPEHYLVYFVGEEGNRFVGYYPAKGLIVTAVMSATTARTIKLDPSLRVSYIYYFTPASDQDALAFGAYIELYVNQQCTLANWQPWNGYVDAAILPYSFECPQKGG